MKKILIYGDSNTWGDNFLTNVRIPDEKQWVSILRKKLGSNYIIFQEGLPGRLAGNEEKEKKFKNGKETFISIFRTNAPIDILIISFSGTSIPKTALILLTFVLITFSLISWSVIGSKSFLLQAVNDNRAINPKITFFIALISF